MARYLITVGGTGQHVALAVLRLVRMGALRNDIRLIALDSDNKTELSRKLEAPTRSLGQERHPLLDGVVKAPFDIAKVGEGSFEEMFVDANHPAERELFECLFSQTEGTIPIHRGMFGTPCVGATVFAEGASTPTLANLLQPMVSASAVFVAGSVVGGTGAGMIHKLVGGIRRYYQGDIFGIFFLPWFTMPANATGSGSITSGVIERNSAHGLKYFYEHTIPSLSASLLIGYPGNTQTKVLRPANVQDGVMDELPSYLHLVAARALMELPQALTAHREVKAYGVIHDNADERWLIKKAWERTAALKDKEYPLATLIRALRIQHNLLRFIVHPENRKDFLGPYRGGIFKADADRFAELDRTIVGNCRDRSRRHGFMEEVLERFAELRAEAEVCLTWIQGFYGDLLEDKTDVLVANLARNNSAKSPFHWQTLQKIWAGTELKADPTIPRTGGDVAEHHGQALFNGALL